MFKLLALAVLFYVGWAILSRKVTIKSGPGWETLSRADEAGRYWLYCGIYAALGVALLTIF
ncbi:MULTISPECIES: hypothetical protein [unclassified Devosia]|uniref:hypothetical protein n=1 Tax=unclassified Devosia TaxID=196773 RepID=UPI001AC3E2A0|nr:MULTISPECIES: hypothetical protein [unclassified Devosia]MBN9304807.1 hypothetical protein [Devosia sp.]